MDCGSVNNVLDPRQTGLDCFILFEQIDVDEPHDSPSPQLPSVPASRLKPTRSFILESDNVLVLLKAIGIQTGIP